MTEPQNPNGQDAVPPQPHGAVPPQPGQQPYGAIPPQPGQQPYGAIPPQPGQQPYGAIPPQPGQQPYGAIPPQPGQQPYMAVPPQPAKKKSKLPWIIGGVILLLILIGAFSCGGSESSDSSSNSSSSTSTDSGNKETAAKETDKKDSDKKDSDKKGSDKAAGLNTPVRDGKFEFVVTDVESGLAEVGDNEFLAQQAQGAYTVVTVTVTNTSDKPQSFSPSDQKLKDTKGRTFESDSTAQIALDNNDIAVWDKINPGNEVTVKLVFDMPKGATPAELELHDSMFSGGTTVNLK